MTNEMTPDLLALLSPEQQAAWERCQKATPGPWKIELNSSMVFVGSAGKPIHNAVLERDVDSFVCNVGSAYVEEEWAEVKDRGAFIANARFDLPAALLELAQTKKALAQLREAIAATPCAENCASKEPGYFPGEVGFRQRGFPYKCDCRKSRLPK